MAECTDHDVVLADRGEAIATTVPQGAEKRRYWEAHIERWQHSGMTQKDYCRDNGLKWSTFHYWRKRIEELSAPMQLIQVAQTPGPTGKERSELMLIIGDHYKIRVGDGFNPATLARLVQTLGQL
jgi:antitoxin (DNA-binding transcriptional repressor) of toxin-antitoxin stability system